MKDKITITPTDIFINGEIPKFNIEKVTVGDIVIGDKIPVTLDCIFSMVEITGARVAMQIEVDPNASVRLPDPDPDLSDLQK